MAPSPSDRISLRLDRALARLGMTALIPVLLLLLAWGQELVDQLFFAGQWNLPMLPGGAVPRRADWVDSTGRRNTGLEKEHKGL